MSLGAFKRRLLCGAPEGLSLCGRRRFYRRPSPWVFKPRRFRAHSSHALSKNPGACVEFKSFAPQGEVPGFGLPSVRPCPGVGVGLIAWVWPTCFQEVSLPLSRVFSEEIVIYVTVDSVSVRRGGFRASCITILNLNPSLFLAMKISQRTMKLRQVSSVCILLKMLLKWRRDKQETRFSINFSPSVKTHGYHNRFSHLNLFLGWTNLLEKNFLGCKNRITL